MSGALGPAFARYVGIDYSGAERPTSSLKDLRVYFAHGGAEAGEVPPPGTGEWLGKRLSEDVPTLAGIDHGFSYPLRYFETHHLPPDWQAFLDVFQQHWPTDGDHVYIDCIRDGVVGNSAGRTGNPRWRRIACVGATKKAGCRSDSRKRYLTM